MPDPAQSETDPRPAELQPEPPPPPPDLKDGDPTVDPKKIMADQGAYAVYPDGEEKVSH